MSSLLTTPQAEVQRRARRDLSRAALAIPLGVSVQAALVAVFLGVSSLGGHSPKSPRARSKSVTLRPLSSARWAANRGPTGKVLPEREAELHPKGQIVDVAPGNNRVAPDAKYVAETNNRVKEETRAREQTQTWSRATPTTQANPTAMPSAKGQPRPAQATQEAPSLLASALGRRPWSLVGEQTSPGTTEQTESTETAPLGTEAGTQGSGSGLTEGGGAPNDDLSGVKEGDGTFLNTREWKFASFFNRVKQAVSAQWDPHGRLRSKNRELGFAERHTVLHVALRGDGSLAEAYVAQSSGIDELDQEAVKAFEKAQPFANPPVAMVEGGFIRFSFGFTVTNGEFAGGTPRFMRFTR